MGVNASRLTYLWWSCICSCSAVTWAELLCSILGPVSNGNSTGILCCVLLCPHICKCVYKGDVLCQKFANIKTGRYLFLTHRPWIRGWVNTFKSKMLVIQLMVRAITVLVSDFLLSPAVDFGCWVRMTTLSLSQCTGRFTRWHHSEGAPKSSEKFYIHLLFPNILYSGAFLSHHLKLKEEKENALLHDFELPFSQFLPSYRAAQ